MKPMEYTQWTLCDCGDTSDGPHYAEQGGVKHWWANERAYFKRLSGAECAAEYWHAAYCEALTLHRADLDAGMMYEHEADTWHRFATTPHAFEGGK